MSSMHIFILAKSQNCSFLPLNLSFAFASAAGKHVKAVSLQPAPIRGHQSKKHHLTSRFSFQDLPRGRWRGHIFRLAQGRPCSALHKGLSFTLRRCIDTNWIACLLQCQGSRRNVSYWGMWPQRCCRQRQTPWVTTILLLIFVLCRRSQSSGCSSGRYKKNNSMCALYNMSS